MKFFIRIYPLLILFLIFFSCEQDSPIQETIPINNDGTSNSFKTNNGLYSISELRSAVEQSGKKLAWDEMEDSKIVFSIGYYSGKNFAIGIKPPVFQGDVHELINDIDLASPEWLLSEAAVVDVIRSGKDNILINKMRGLPFITAKISDFETIDRLMSNPNVYFVEPLGNVHKVLKGDIRDFEGKNNPPGGNGGIDYGTDEYLNIGCSCQPSTTVLSRDYTAFNSNPFTNKLPWNYEKHNLFVSTWNSYDGDDVGVAVIDTGVLIVDYIL